MRPLVTAFALGAGSVGVLAAAAALAVVLVAEAAGSGGFRLALGPVVFLAFERHGAATEAGLGPGLLLAALAGGTLNAAGAWLIRRRGTSSAGGFP